MRENGRSPKSPTPEPADANGSPRNATPAAAPSLGQLALLERLLAGVPVTQAAEAGGVDRTTVHRWLRDDFEFQAAYNRVHRELCREVEVRLSRLAGAALETVAEALEAGDVRAALVVLKGLGALSGSPVAIASDDPIELAEDARLAAREQASERGMRRLLAD